MRRVRSLGLLLIMALLVAVAVVALRPPVGEWLVALLVWIDGRGAWTAAILGAIWVPAAVLLVPGSAITLGTGFLLGPVWGTVVVSLGSTAGATAAFLIGRRLGRRWVSERLAGHPRLAALDAAIEREGLKVVALTRLSPLFPYNVLNYAYSLTAVPRRDFILGSWLGMLPGTLLYVVMGSGARTLAELAAGRLERRPEQLALLALGLLATVAVTLLLARAAGRALADRTGERSAA